MSDDKPPRGLSPRDAELWARIARTVKPLPGHERPATPPRGKSLGKSPGASAPPREKPATTPGGAGGRKTPAPSAPPERPSTATPPSRPRRPPPGGTLDRRTRQRMARGIVDIDARLDLHGFGVEEAHARLRAFIIGARAQGLRTVLVITGKGASPFSRHTLHGYDHWHAPERAGRLRRLLPEWLGEAGIAEHVAGFQPAHPKHGGGGAFYVRLRRPGR